MKQIVLGSVSMLALVAAVGCGGGGANVEVKGGGSGKVGGKEVAKEQPGGAPVTKEAADAFTQATMEFKANEEARSWDDAKCTSVSAKFLAAGQAQGGKFPAAHYNAGITLLRCSREADAEKEFQIALDEKASMGAKDPVFHQVWVQKAMIRYRKGDVAGINEAIEIIRSKGFDPDALSNVEAFMSLGLLYRERWNKDLKHPDRSKKDDFGLEDDLARAQFWLQNALSINDSFMPAYNQLALFYLDKARAVAAKKAKGPKVVAAKGKEQTEAEKQEAKSKSDLQTLELGLLVSEEASRRDPGYAGIWNSQGLILLEMGRTGSATKAFQQATQKDPKFFEAWMNYAAINLQFRGYAEAAKGYESAAALRPKDYDAKLGLAVSLRGQLDQYLTAKQEIERAVSECSDPDYAKEHGPKCSKASAESGKIKEFEGKFLDYYKRAGVAYDGARDADPSRIEAYFNKALLVEKYKAKAETSVTTGAAYREAEKLYNEIVTKFGGQEKYAKLVANVKDRAEEARKSAEFEEKAMAAPPIPPPPAASAAPAASGSAAPAPAASAKK